MKISLVLKFVDRVCGNFVVRMNAIGKVVEKEEIEIAIMKSKSPSCGYGYIYDGSHSRKLVEGNGITVEELLKVGVKIISA